MKFLMSQFVCDKVAVLRTKSEFSSELLPNNSLSEE